MACRAMPFDSEAYSVHPLGSGPELLTVGTKKESPIITSYAHESYLVYSWRAKLKTSPYR